MSDPMKRGDTGEDGHEASYRATVERTAGMVGDASVRTLARGHGLDVVNVTWEDTGRYKDSAVGPNISDMTIQVHQDRGKRLTCMPVIRHPNFQDHSADVAPGRFHVLVGNHRGGALERITLEDLLRDPTRAMTRPEPWQRSRPSLWAERDTHVLVSAQACFLPIPRGGSARFNPVLFNYHSVAGDPAVLTILATREGTSVTVIDNVRDAFEEGNGWGQRLFHNQAGERAPFTGQRQTDHRAAGGAANDAEDAPSEEGLSMVLLVQVPLKQRNPRPDVAMMDLCSGGLGGMGALGGGGDVEQAVIGHGAVEGPFTELDGLSIERDLRFPVRVTVQFYKATSNGVVTAADMRAITEQIDRVYRDGDFVGSLVMGGETTRPTEHGAARREPPAWWNDFWARHEANTGQTREQALAAAARLFGPGWEPSSPEELARVVRSGRLLF